MPINLKYGGNQLVQLTWPYMMVAYTPDIIYHEVEKVQNYYLKKGRND